MKTFSKIDFITSNILSVRNNKFKELCHDVQVVYKVSLAIVELEDEP